MTRLMNMLTRGVVALAKPTTKMQALQMRLTHGEVKDSMEHLEPYGFTSCPHEGAEGLAAFMGGDRSHGVVVVVADRRYRLTALQAGEVAIYTDEGDKIHLKRGRIIDIETGTLNIRAATAVNIDAPVINQTGRIVSQGDQVAGGVSQINHLHAGVKQGTDQSGAPIPGGGA
ncbi:phage baseplate assembly protein V [Pseudomonas sp. RIT-PI-S]|uniref:phage baseplate assembly protein V n=1 Tax=Pseudomonas sp. RIT-PI-S TaxID=3035295 RepID=UPI0021DB0931|nr:phage baseplate assembly protein V [Pseudomonas sp. RIT-PI-S]